MKTIKAIAFCLALLLVFFAVPLDEFVTVGPAEGVIQQYCRTIPQSGYGKIYATQLGNGLYQIVNGHHRVAALRALGYETIKFFLTK